MSFDNSKELKILGDRVRKFRKDAKLSQEALALDSGISRRVLQKIEYGTEPFSVVLLFSILKTLRITPSDFFKDFAIEFESL